MTFLGRSSCKRVSGVCAVVLFSLVLLLLLEFRVVIGQEEHDVDFLG